MAQVGKAGLLSISLLMRHPLIQAHTFDFRVFVLVYCNKCGATNEDNAEFCAECGATLYPDVLKGETRGMSEEKDECFGLPHGGAIGGLFIGTLIVISGLSWYLGWDLSTIWETAIGPFVVIFIGILIILGALYSIKQGR